MSKTEPDARSSESPFNRSTPDTYTVAAQLGVDAALLREFVGHHPAPTTAAVLAWVNKKTNTDPSQYVDEVEEWLAAYTSKTTVEPTPIAADTELPNDGRLPQRWFQ